MMWQNYIGTFRTMHSDKEQGCGEGVKDWNVCDHMQLEAASQELEL